MTDDLSHDILRSFIIAQSLEPLADKPGCTTRWVDSTPGTKLEYFIIAAANSASPVMKLVERVLARGGQPEVVFDLFHNAQLRSAENRHGGKVNYAQILMLLPIILGQALLSFEGGDPRNIDEICDRARRAMAETSTKDVYHLQKFVNLSREFSERHHRRQGTFRPQLFPVFEDRYETVLAATHAKDFSHTVMATEIRDSYPYSRRVCRELLADEHVGVLKQSEIAYGPLREELGRHDIAADVIVVALYLALISSGGRVLFP